MNSRPPKFRKRANRPTERPARPPLSHPAKAATALKPAAPSRGTRQKFAPHSKSKNNATHPARGRSAPDQNDGPKHGLARILSKLGYCSRSEGTKLVLLGRVTLNGRICRNPDQPANANQDQFLVDGQPVERQQKVYILLNKPAGSVRTVFDETRRLTVFTCSAFHSGQVAGGDQVTRLSKPASPVAHRLEVRGRLSPVSRPDPSVEGALLFTNDPVWSEQISMSASPVRRTFEAVLAHPADEAGIAQLRAPGSSPNADLGGGTISHVMVSGDRRRLTWTSEIDDGVRLRRWLAAFGFRVSTLSRIAIGPVSLGPLAKGQWRHLTIREVATLVGPAPDSNAEESQPGTPEVNVSRRAQQKGRAPEDAPWNS